jgi:hypothetical protein
MSKKQIVDALFGVILVGICLFILYLFLSMLLGALNSINSDLSKAIVGAILAVTVASVTLVGGKLLEQKISINQDIRQKKIPVYEEQLKVFFRMLFAEKIGEEPIKEMDMLKAFANFSEKLIFWGGPNAIKAWEEFRNYPWAQSNTSDALLAFERFLFALRKDIGNSNIGLSQGDILKLFINDLELPRRKKP